MNTTRLNILANVTSKMQNLKAKEANLTVNGNDSVSDMMNQNSKLATPFVANPGDTAWVLISTALVFIMIMGLGIFYSGFVRRSNMLAVFMSTYVPASIVIIQWVLFGFSLVYSTTGNSMIGNFDFALLKNVGNDSHPAAPTIPSNLFMVYQSLFAAITPSLIFGAIAERVTISSFIIVSVIWSTLVYDFVAYWTWNPTGWLRVLGALDFAGGGPVHIASGFGALAYAIVVGPRINKLKQPVNLANIYIGTGLLWFGWIGFNGGSESALNSRAVNAVVTSNLAAGTCGLTWILLEMIFKRTKKTSLNAFCSGAVAGLVAITPACGFVSPFSSLLVGFLAAIFCYLAGLIKKIKCLNFDDTSDVFAVHGVGGIVGSLLTGILAQNSIATMGNDAPIPGGFFDKNYIQLAYQLCAVVVTAAWSFVITFIIVKIIDLIPFIQLRLDESEQEKGADEVEIGENAFEQEHFKSKVKKVSTIEESSNVGEGVVATNEENAFEMYKKEKRASVGSKKSYAPIHPAEMERKF